VAHWDVAMQSDCAAALHGLASIYHNNNNNNNDNDNNDNDEMLNVLIELRDKLLSNATGSDASQRCGSILALSSLLNGLLSDNCSSKQCRLIVDQSTLSKLLSLPCHLVNIYHLALFV
jgi:hypothetical protein